MSPQIKLLISQAILCVGLVGIGIGVSMFRPQKEVSNEMDAVEVSVTVPEQIALDASPAPALIPVSVPAVPAVQKPTEYVALSVPFHYQIYSLSCEAASLQMALGEKGVIQSQDALLALIGNAEPYKSYTKDGELIWGDPDLGFVGNVQGYFTARGGGLASATGWGVSNIRIGEIASELRPGSASYFNFTTSQIKKELKAGNPVIFWHRPDNYPSTSLAYHTPAGKEVTFTEDHVAVITGYEVIGGVTKFLINDPIEGKYTYTEKGLARVMARREGRVVVVR